MQQQITAKLKVPESTPSYAPQSEFSQARMHEDLGFDSPAPQRQTTTANEDGFKVVGYIYPQGDQKSP